MSASLSHLRKGRSTFHVPRSILLGALAAALYGCGGGGTSYGTTSAYGNSYGGGYGSFGSDNLTMGQQQQVVSEGTRTLQQGSAPQITSGENQFGFTLFQKVTKAQPDANVCISPVSVGAVMSMLYNGAAGDTQKQIAQSLNLSKLSVDQLNEANKTLEAVLMNLDTDKVQLNISNSIWADAGSTLSPDFVQKNQDFYRARVSTLDFHAPEAPDTINNWVKDTTKGKIPQIIQQVPTDARLYVINAVYFNGSWQRPFEKNLTQPGTFTLTDGTTEQAPMMNQTGSFGYFKTNDVTGISIPYGTGRLEMVIAVPAGKLDIPGLEKKLDASLYNGWTKASKSTPLQISIPTFKSDYDVSLNDSLKAMGVANAFDSAKADFSGMLNKGSSTIGTVANQKLFLSDVKHKTTIDVTEQGTEAAATTGVQMSRSAMVSPPTKFAADHPFLYFIRDSQTGAILFNGVVLDPVQHPKKDTKSQSSKSS